MMANVTQPDTAIADADKAQPSPIDSCLRVLHNKIRNLKKQIEKASGYEAAELRGDPLNDEQRESIKNKAIKLIFLKEVEELKRRQEVIVGRFRAGELGADEKTSETNGGKADGGKGGKALHNGDSAKKKKRSKRKKKAKTSADDRAGSPPPSAENVVGAEVKPPVAVREHVTSVPSEEKPEKITVVPTKRATDTPPNQQAALDLGKGESEGPARGMEKYNASEESSHIHSLSKAEIIRKILDLMHVFQFLREEPNGPAELLACFANTGQNISSQDLASVTYFGVMLTTPNGNVPHQEAVSVSSSHCQDYLDLKDSEAFPQVKYKDLARIVEAIANCPLLKDRVHTAAIAPDEMNSDSNEMNSGSNEMNSDSKLTDFTESQPDPSIASSLAVASVDR